MDFLQGRIATIHDFGVDLEKISVRLKALSVQKPICLILPMLYSEIKSESLSQILDELSQCDFLTKVSVALSASNKREYREVVELFDELPIPHSVIWCNSPNIQRILNEVAKRGIDVSGFSGKGRDVWIAIGVESTRHYALGFHDVDIVNYSRSIPIKLFYPILEEQMDFFFNKGYYARIGIKDRQIYGRVVRLLVFPLIEAFEQHIKQPSDFIKYMQSFKYPLAGEFAITSDLAENIRIPADWGFEIGLLAEVYRNA
jgi:glucosyl-3-phosphoglycerate synthase